MVFESLELRDVGYVIRFEDVTGPKTVIKVSLSNSTFNWIIYYH